MSKFYSSEGDPVCSCTVGAECGHHENEHRSLIYALGDMVHLTCTRGDLAVSMVGGGDASEVFAAKFSEHLAEVGEDQ